MLNDLKSLPNNPAELKKIIAKQDEQIEILKQQYENLQHQLKNLLRSNYGSKTEKYINPQQMSLFDESDLPKVEPLPEIKEKITYERKKRRNGRNKIPKALLREVIELDLPEEEKYCSCGCGRKLRKIGEEVLEQLEFIPAKLYVRRFVKFKYAGCSNGSVITAKLPPQPIDKGLAGPGLLAAIAIDKYQDHCPLHRQEQKFARHGLDLRRSTLSDWVKQTAFLLGPIVEEMAKDVLKAKKIHSDDTIIPLQTTEKKGKLKKARLWIYLGCGANSPPVAVYDYSRTREGAAPQTFLDKYKGYVQADAYSGYDKLFQAEGVIEVGCWAHARRKFFEVAKNSKNPDIANQALVYIQELYKVEKIAKEKELEANSKKLLRQEKSKPILEAFKKWLENNVDYVLPKSPLGQAMQYTVNQWEALNEYINNGILDIDNNKAERLMRPIALGRKNWLKISNDRSGKAAAILFSLIETCKLNKINTFDYLRDTLTKLPTCKAKDIRSLLPYEWQEKSKK